MNVKPQEVYTSLEGLARITVQVTDQQEALFAGAVAKLLNVGVQTLHFYEREGLIPEAPRTESGYRVYPPELVERVRFIKQAQGLGLPLSEVREILSLAEDGGSPCGRVQAALGEKLKEVDRRLIELRRFRHDLAELIDRAGTEYETRSDARVCSIVERAKPSGAIAAGSSSLTKLKRKAVRR